MTRVRIRRFAAALLLSLAACEEGITTPRAFAGNWLAVEVTGTSGEYRLEDRLELREDGSYRWTTASFTPAGRAEDGFSAWFERGGGWGVEGDWLALRTTAGMAWEHGRGWRQLDYVSQWTRGHRVRMEGDRLILEEVLPPEISRVPRTFLFERVPDFDDAPTPPPAEQ